MEKEVFSKDLSNYKIVKQGMIAYNPSRINVGSVACQNKAENVIVSPLYIVFSVDASVILPEILELFLKSNIGQKQIKSLTSGSVRDSLKYSALEKEILGVFSKLSILIDQRKQQLNKINQLAKSRFIEMFGDPISNSKNLETKKGEELFSFSSGKFNPSKNLTCSNPYPCYGGNGITGYSKDFILETPTVVIGRVGAYCGSVHITKPKSWITDNAIYLKQYNKKDYRLLFIYFLFLFFKFNRFSSASGQPKITQKPLEQSNFILPTIDLQDIFVNFIEQLDKSKFRMKKCLKLFTYMRHLWKIEI